MEEEKLIQAIEKLYKEKKDLKKSKEYRLGNSIIKLKENIKSFNIKGIFNKIHEKKLNKIDRKKFFMHQPAEINQEVRISNQDFSNKKIVVYTCITGKYDSVYEPLYHKKNVDYVIYTNAEDIKTQEWIKREIPNSIKELNSNVLINRYIKMHPKEIFGEEYEFAIYIDGNIRTISDITSFINCINDKTGLAIHRHYARKSIYVEVEACKLYGKGNPQKLDEQVRRYKKEGFPVDYGLLECNVIVSDLKNDKATQILDSWWKEYIKSESGRDQISLPYVLWKNKYELIDVGNLGNNVYNNSKIEVMGHKKQK